MPGAVVCYQAKEAQVIGCNAIKGNWARLPAIPFPDLPLGARSDPFPSVEADGVLGVFLVWE